VKDARLLDGISAQELERRLVGRRIRSAQRHGVNRRRPFTPDLECTPAGGQGQAADLTVCRACSFSNVTGLR
jgi:hypothetical protein